MRGEGTIPRRTKRGNRSTELTKGAQAKKREKEQKGPGQKREKVSDVCFGGEKETGQTAI